MLIFLLILGLFAMSDFPPNLEDGEQWLPSDIYEEIISEFNFKPKSRVDTNGQNLSIKIESLDDKGNNMGHRNYEKSYGTGVYIPQRTQLKWDPKRGVRIGTGVYLPNMSAMKEQVINGVPNLEKSHPAKT